MSKARQKLTASQQIDAITKIMQQFDSKNVKIVHVLELPTPRTRPKLRDEGALTEEALRGYGFFLHCYKMVHYDDLSLYATRKIDKTRFIIDQLANQKQIINGIISDNDDFLKKTAYTKETRAAAPYHLELQAYVDSQYDILKHGKLHLLAGTSTHHAIYKLIKREKKLFLTIYNAGFDSKDSPNHPNLNMGICEYECSNPTPKRIKSFLRTTAEQLLRAHDSGAQLALQNYAQLKTDSEAFLGPLTRHVDSPPQHKSNCTTRSTREMLRDDFSPQQFNHIYSFITRCSAAGHQQLLKDRLAELEPASPAPPPSPASSEECKYFLPQGIPEARTHVQRLALSRPASLSIQR